MLKFLLWQHGGLRITIGDDPAIADALAKVYSPTGNGRSTTTLLGKSVRVPAGNRGLCLRSRAPCPSVFDPAGRHFGGCRIGFDLGGTGRKCAAMIDGRVVFSEWVTGGVTSGLEGQVMGAKTQRVLNDEFSTLAGSVYLRLPGEKEKSHGQAVAAATLLELGGKKLPHTSR